MWNEGINLTPGLLRGSALDLNIFSISCTSLILDIS